MPPVEELDVMFSELVVSKSQTSILAVVGSQEGEERMWMVWFS